MRHGYRHVVLESSKSRRLTHPIEDTDEETAFWTVFNLNVPFFSEATLPGARRPTRRIGAGNNAVEADNDNDMKNSTPFYNGAENVESYETRIRQSTSRPKQPMVGHLVTSSGLKPDPEKVEAIQKMPRDQKISS